VGFKPTLVAGMVIIAAGLLWLTQVSAPGGSYVGDILFPSIIVGIGLGLAFVPVTVAAVSGTRPDEAGLASGLINTSQQVGGALGLAILSAIANSRTTTALGDGLNQAQALTSGFRLAFMVGAGFAILGAILGAVMISSKESREHAIAAQNGEVATVAA
jgi:hypothetical protein